MRTLTAIVCLGFVAGVAFAQVEAPSKSDSKHSDGISTSPQAKGVEQPQGPTGPTETKSGGAPAESPQGQTPPGMQAAPDGSRKTVVEPSSSDKSPPSQTEEKGPSATAPRSADTIFQNGILTVPGADPDNQAAPAKFSKRTNASDQLSIAAYALKHLTAEQRARIFNALRRDMAMSGSVEVEPLVGAEIPASVTLDGLQPLPNQLVMDIPELRGLAVVRGGDKILLLSPTMQRVLAVLEQ
jgi:hypothetical protein